MTDSEREQLKIMRNVIALILHTLADGYSRTDMNVLAETYNKMIEEAMNKKTDNTND